MRNNCDDWQPDPAEVEYLTLFGAERDVVLAIGDFDRVPPWRIGEVAGFSGGKTRDEKQRRLNLSSSVSRATRKRRQLLPAIAGLQDHLKRFRTDGGKPQSVSWQEMLQRCDHLIRHGDPQHLLRAIELKTKLTGKQNEVTAEQVMAAFIGRLGADQAKAGLTALGCGHLVNKAPHLFESKPDDTEARLSRLEQHAEAEKHEREQTGPSGNGAASPDVGRRDRVRAAVAPKVGAGRGDAGGAGGRGERDGERSAERGAKREVDDEAFMRQWQRGIGL